MSSKCTATRPDCLRDTWSWREKESDWNDRERRRDNQHRGAHGTTVRLWPARRKQREKAAQAPNLAYKSLILKCTEFWKLMGGHSIILIRMIYKIIKKFIDFFFFLNWIFYFKKYAQKNVGWDD